MSSIRNTAIIIKKVIWDIYWKNPNSAWASGKTVSDYVVLTTPVANGTTAKLNQGENDYFGEQIIVKATAFYDTSISATATVDCCKEFQDFKVEGYDDDTTFYFTQGQKIVADDSYKFTFGVGTVSPTVYYDGICYEFAPYDDDPDVLYDSATVKSLYNDVVNKILTDNGIASSECSFDIQREFKNTAAFDINNFFKVSSEATRDKVGYKLAFNKVLEFFKNPGFSLALKIYIPARYNGYQCGFIRKTLSFTDFNISSLQPYKIVSSVSFTDDTAIF